MTIFTLESLVLRGVAVLRDGTFSLRRGVAGVAYGPAPEVRISMRQASPGWVQGSEPNARPDHAKQNRMDADANGAGRPLSRAGVLRRSFAITASGAVQLLGQLLKPRGPKFPAAPRLCLAEARCAAVRTPPASTWETGT